MMRVLGVVLAVCATIGLIMVMNFDTTVSTGYGGRVANLQLMSEKQNWLLLNGLALIVSIAMIAFGKPTDARQCPACAETIKAEAVKCRHCHADVAPVQPMSNPSRKGADKAFMIAMGAVIAVVVVMAVTVSLLDKSEQVDSDAESARLTEEARKACADSDAAGVFVKGCEEYR